MMGGGVSEGGCADASIYARFHRAGLTQIRMLPQVSSFNRGPNLQNWQTQVLFVLAKEEVVRRHRHHGPRHQRLAILGTQEAGPKCS